MELDVAYRLAAFVGGDLVGVGGGALMTPILLLLGAGFIAVRGLSA